MEAVTGSRSCPLCSGAESQVKAMNLTPSAPTLFMCDLVWQNIELHADMQQLCVDWLQFLHCRRWRIFWDHFDFVVWFVSSVCLYHFMVTTFASGFWCQSFPISRACFHMVLDIYEFYVRNMESWHCYELWGVFLQVSKVFFLTSCGSICCRFVVYFYFRLSAFALHFSVWHPWVEGVFAAIWTICTSGVGAKYF